LTDVRRKFGFTEKVPQEHFPLDTRKFRKITVPKGNLYLFQAAWAQVHGFWLAQKKLWRYLLGPQRMGQDE
jgi:hypothetical protein